MDLDPILGFFPFFLLGTVFGEIIYEIFNYEDSAQRKQALKKKLILPIAFLSPILIIGGIILEINLDVNYMQGFSEPFPDFLLRGSFPWMFYSLGIFLILLCIFISSEEYNALKTKKEHKFFFYFSYYSLTVYLAHNILYFVFFKQLNIFFIWFYLAGIFIIMFLLLRIFYNKWEGTPSIKFQIGRLAAEIANLIEKKKNERKN